MARIPDALIEWLKANVPVQRLAQARGVVLRRQGADLIGRCPFHEDRTPSLVVTPAKNLWHCFGACQAGGTVIDWVMRAQGVSFRHAVQLLQNEAAPGSSPLAAAPVSDGPSAMPAKRATTKKLAMPLQRTAQDAQLLGEMIEHYHRVLLHSPHALDYLKRRGIGNEEAIGTFKLGFANRSLGEWLAQKSRNPGGQTRWRLQRLGFLRESGHERFNGSIVIPVIDERGEVTDVYGRKINDNPPGTPRHMYLPGPHRSVWNAAALSGPAGAGPGAPGGADSACEVILCEALIDALTFWCAGLRNVTASYGVQGFTADHWALFKQRGVQRVLIAYDRDDAGDRAAQKLARQLTAEGIDCYRVLFPKGMDANEYALTASPAAHSLAAAIRSAQRLGRGRRGTAR